MRRPIKTIITLTFAAAALVLPAALAFLPAYRAGGPLLSRVSAQDQGIEDKIEKKESELDRLRRQIAEQRKK
ncbi:MAG TPA: hypothetical protein VLA34_03195, partial [Candidatus Krumholzibacterium sp.]|nr:hypothetical protein [Candidatus Krumholzibacterium sp.]